MASLDEAQFKTLKSQIKVNLAPFRGKGGAEEISKEEAFELSQFYSVENFDREMQDSGLKARTIYHNTTPAILYEEALKNEEGSFLTDTGALAVSSGAKTGRSPTDKRIVDHPSLKDIWWGKVNIKLQEASFEILKERAVDYLNTRERLYVVDGYAGWDPELRIKIRVIAARAYHALFMQNMLVIPSTIEELKDFHPDFVIYNAGAFPANIHTRGMTSATSVALNFQKGELVILGTDYAGEMKKGVLTLMMYHMPLRGHLCLHSSATVGKEGDVTVFFGLSGTGKTTLSADPHRFLIGDDEHVWTDKGVFNVEGGCYAKVVDLSAEKEPEIFDSVTFGSVLENVRFDKFTRIVDYSDTSITENTRCAYPLEYIPNSIIPAAVSSHPRAIVLLCCDAFGVLPPVSRLTEEQVQYLFISGYTAKVAGTEEGIKQPTATFSACFGAPFLVWHPTVYAELLAKKLKEHKASAYLLNTGWVGGAYGAGRRCPLKYTRLIVDAINSGKLVDSPTENLPYFNLPVPTNVPGVPREILIPWEGWKNRSEYEEQLKKLGGLFCNNFKEYEDKCPAEVVAAGPKV